MKDKPKKFYVGYVNGRPHREKVYGETGGPVLTLFYFKKDASKVYEDVRAVSFSNAKGTDE